MAEQVKARKDLAQATQVLEVLIEDRPQDLTAAWKSVKQTKSPQRRIRAAARRLDPDLRRRLAEALSEPDVADD